MEYRKLQEKEISIMESLGCSCKDWTLVEVVEDFLPDRVRESSFSGYVKLGKFQKEFLLPGGMVKKSGIRNVAFHNVIVGNDCYIENVHNYIANYRIEDGTFIENVDIIAVDGVSTFGNGIEVKVLNEIGGREVFIHNKLSSHLAYFSALYRHRPKLIERINALTEFYTQKHSSDTGFIGKNSFIINTGKILNVYIGDSCKIDGTSLLENGTINSCESAAVYIGVKVMAKNFIVMCGSKLDTGCCIENCFVGQNTTLANNYSAIDSVFFANCHGENGEACSIFAGPFTVTHHRSSLLIAGLFSFMNAGSGSNQSNHLYKLGPIHQGIMERGSKTSSDSYILWPAHIGAFSLVMGRHVYHSDTSNFPFSYLIEKNNTTFLSPGVNLRSVGTIRDAVKWPQRDKRLKDNRLDCINYNLLSPYTVQKMFNGMDILEGIKKTCGDISNFYSYQSIKITVSSLNKGIAYYNIGIKKFLGNSIIKRLEPLFEKISTYNNEENILADRNELIDYMHTLLAKGNYETEGDWVDIGGLIAPKLKIENLLNRIEHGEVKKLGEINDELKMIHTNYYEYEWDWAYKKINEYFDINLDYISPDKVISIIEEWKEAVVSLDKMLFEDAKKEFSLAVRTSFGADGSESDKASDFAHVRGEFDNNQFVTSVLDHIEIKSNLADFAIGALSKIAINK